MKKLAKFLPAFISLVLISGFSLAIFIIYLTNKLPSVDALRNIQLQVPLRIFSQDNKLIAEFGEQRRIPVHIEDMPQHLIQAVLATEDQRFYEHSGVDMRGLARAAAAVISDGAKSQGGSTITMQVARNFFLTRNKTFSRKFNEILLAFKIDKSMTKDEILELYLNKVFFGQRAYGVGAAAEVYYGKSLDELTLAENAMIAGLPKAPSAINPITDPVAAKARREHVLSRMLDQHYITQAEYEEANNMPVHAVYHGVTQELDAPYIAEMVRIQMEERYGEAVYTHGYQIITTINSADQQAADAAVQNALIAYDQRHGYRGPLEHIDLNDREAKADLSAALKRWPITGGLYPALVNTVREQSIDVITLNDTFTIDWDGLSWARKDLPGLRIGYAPTQASDVLSVGDIIYVHYNEKKNIWVLAQVPEVAGALVSLNPQDGAVLALVGGFDFNESKFNRVTQAQLQPGSNFKPFIYSSALDKGFTPASIINDAPIVLTDPSQEAQWRPQNDNLIFSGPTSLRMGLIRSRNLVSIRVLHAIGIPYAIDYLSRFGFPQERLPQGLSLALGTANLSPMEMATGYAVFANGGFKVTPYFIAQIKDSFGDVIFEANPETACINCPATTSIETIPESLQKTDYHPRAPRVISAQNAYIMTDLLKDAVNRGTGRRALVLNRSDIGGKTGTTNNQYDAWFSGFNNDVVTSVWVGFDTPQSLGEYAAQAALPMWIDYMAAALKDAPEHTLSEPDGLVTVRIDPKSGLLAPSTQNDAVFEIFQENSVPTRYAPSPQNNGYNPTMNTSTQPEMLF